MDCTKCGACCSTDPLCDSYVDATPQEAALIPAEHLLERGPHGWYPLRVKKDRQGHTVCVAFRGVIGYRANCSIYNNRPAMCKELEPGSEACLLHRADLGIE